MPWAEPVKIVKVIRRMRGGSQSFLVQGNDESYYVCKFAGNPQGNRTLVNEVIAGHLLSVLGIAVPEIVILRLDDRCEGRAELRFSTDPPVAVVSGLHLGSKCPVDPDRVAIFDFLPRSLSAHVANLDDVGLVFAFDQWVAHIDQRQFIFARSPNPQNRSTSRRSGGYFLRAWAIDNGMCFGRDWTLKEQPLYAYHPCLDIYSQFNVRESVYRGTQLIRSMPDSELEAVCPHIPQEWFAPGDDSALCEMFSALRQRKKNLEDIRGRLEALKRLRD